VAAGVVVSPGIPPWTNIDCDLPDACLASDPFAGDGEAADILAGDEETLIDGDEFEIAPAELSEVMAGEDEDV